MLSAHPFWSLEVPRLDGQLLLTPCPACGGAGCQVCVGTGVGGRRLTAELLEY